nr:MAG TPA: hypothetical protein [Caudoviricetes sp.]
MGSEGCDSLTTHIKPQLGKRSSSSFCAIVVRFYGEAQ